MGITGNYITLDFETMYSKDYSLRKMTPVEYILDPRFECHGAAVAFGDDSSPAWLSPAELKNYLVGKRSEGKLVVVSHNALFDMCILAWKFGIVPDLMIDTIGMSRAMLFAQTGSVSLKKVAEHLGLGEKGGIIADVQGMNAAMIKAAGLWNAYTNYACNDVELGRGIFKALRKEFPAREYLVQDTVLRCAITPRFKLDGVRLAEHLHAVKVAKEHLLGRVALVVESQKDLLSAEKFAQCLRLLGVEPPTKVSPVTGKEVYAFAKTDQAMAELEEHDDPTVQALVAARLGYKSTLEETRTERLLEISRLNWGRLGAGWLPVPLRYSGAHTHRLSGDWKLNLQNFPSGGELRRALVAPLGHTVVAADASQIEARIVAWLAGETDLVEAFAQGADVYSKFGTENVYAYPVSKATPKERFVCKQAVLGLGFGMGWMKFQLQIRKDSRLRLKDEIVLEDHEAVRIVEAYRSGYKRIPRAWKELEGHLPLLAGGGGEKMFGPCLIRKGEIVLPNGLKLFYPHLDQIPSNNGDEWRKEWVFTYGKKYKKIFGGKLFENIVQALARIVVMDAALRMRSMFPKIPLALQVHDELVYVVPNDLVDEFRSALETAMVIAPKWAAGLPLGVESETGPNYGECKP
jgi:DNA polymerase